MGGFLVNISMYLTLNKRGRYFIRSAAHGLAAGGRYFSTKWNGVWQNQSIVTWVAFGDHISYLNLILIPNYLANRYKKESKTWIALCLCASEISRVAFQIPDFPLWPSNLPQTCMKRTHLGIFPPCGSWWWNCSTRTVTTTDKPTIIMVLAKYWAEQRREHKGTSKQNALLDTKVLKAKTKLRKWRFSPVKRVWNPSSDQIYPYSSCSICNMLIPADQGLSC